MLSGLLALVPMGNVWAAPCATDKDGKSMTYFDWGCDPANGDNGLTQLAWVIFNIVAGLVAAACLGAIVYGAIRYSAANSNASAAKEGLDIIRNAVLALVLYGVFWSLVNLLTGKW